jgi:hypothetical protein
VTLLDSFETIEAPDLAEPIDAWRIWRVVVDGGRCRLGSVVKPTIWPSGDALVAQCLRTSRVSRWFRRRRGEPHGVPASSCECGIYGAALRECGQYLNLAPMDTSAPRVLGRVSLWGTVIECERGFRASHAYPSRIYVPADPSAKAGKWERLAAGLEVYGVPIELLPAGRSEAIEALERQHVAAARRASG